MEKKSGLTQEAGLMEGRYANYFEIGYNAFEFLLDFGQHYPECEEGFTHTRIVISPSYAKVLFQTLKESIEKYEQAFGHLKEI